MTFNEFTLAPSAKRGFLKYVHVHEAVLVLFLRVNAADE